MYMNNTIPEIRKVTKGIMKKISIWDKLTIVINTKMGPSTASIKTNIKAKSSIPKSFENLFTRMPEGVESKKWAGLRTIASTIV